MNECDVKNEICEFSKIMEEKNLVNTYEGNLSIKYNQRIYITPSGKRKAVLTPDMIAILDLEGNQTGGSLQASSERLLHTEMYRMRPDANACIHCHPTYLTAHALSSKEPLASAAYPEMIVNFKEIPVAKYGRPGTVEIADDVGKYIHNRPVVLLEGHGVVGVGKNMLEVFSSIEACEAMAKVLAVIKMTGKDEIPRDKTEFKRLYDIPIKL